MPASKVSESDFRLAVTLQSRRRLRDAEVVYLRILDSDRFNVRALEALGRLRLQQKRYSEAVSPLRTLVKRVKGSADAHHLLGFALTGLGNWSGAVRNYQKAISLQADFPDAHNNCCYALHQLGQYEAALAHIDKAIDLLPVFPDAYHNRGSALVALGRRHEALVALQTALVQKPTHVAARSDLAKLLADLRYGDDATLQHLSSALDIDTLNAVGDIYLHREEYELAKPVFLGTRLRDQGSYDALIGLVNAYQNLGDSVAARLLLGEMLRRGMRKAEVLVKIANLTFAEPGTHILHELDQIRVGDLSDDARISVAFARGRLLYLSGKWSQAWTTLTEINRQVWERVREERVEESLHEKRALASLQTHTPQPLLEDKSRPTLLFILGTSRSGKTVVESALSGFGEVHRGMENAFVRNALSFARRNAAMVGSEIASDDSHEVRTLFRQSYFEALDQRVSGHKIFTTTNPGLIRRAAWLADTLPNVRFLFVTRDTQDTALSLMLKQYKKAHYYSYDLEASFEHIEWYHEMISEFAATYPGISRTVSYEDIVTDPEIIYQAVEELCDVSIDTSKAMPILADDRSCAQPYRSLLRDSLAQVDHLNRPGSVGGDLT
ncbi:MAG: tetratricopeptide repeat protein [Mesorhizobium sp.]|uniref:tetratricopeptide repeat-containing sulfotransferase family protein n=1 Tax=Mesorhizobium sp. TaxID=1871066 RepID=UPI0012144118|nr:sulfotransferase family protein [Mesorhizobium sp.]TIM13651.1 MAG: tetratricopeptide repeat protein [Mesorhizobium sp.]